MGGIIWNISLLILLIEYITGNLGNGFIALLNCMAWVKGRRLSLADKILTALAISRIGAMWTVLLSMLIAVLKPGLFMSAKVFRLINIVWTLTNHLSIWLATCLSIFYFLKIANFSHFIFLYLKWRVKKVISVTLLVSLVFSFINTIVTDKLIDVWIFGSKRSMSYSSSPSNSTNISKLVLFTNSMFMFVPFTVSLMAFLLLILSLWKHNKKMQHNTAGSRDASTTAHIRALQTGVAFFLLYSICLLSLVLKVSSFELMETDLIILFDRATGIAFPAGHSFVLILGNSKLRRASLSVLGWLRCRSKDKQPLDL